MLRQLLTVICFCLIGVFSIAQTSREALSQKIQQKLDNWRQANNAPGASLALHTGSESWTWTSGLADREKNLPMRPEAMLFSGSVGKTYVSAIMLQLVAEGKIDLDARIQPYFAGEKWYNCLPNAGELTLKMLLNHTSGLGRYIFQASFLEQLKKDPMQKVSPQQGLQHLCGTAAVHPPGKGWAYSDSNYLIVGLLIEQLTGKTYYEVLQERIFSKLALEQTKPTTSRQLAGLVPGYIGEHNFFELPQKVLDEQGLYVMDPSFEYTGGGLYCTTADLARWINLLHSGLVLPDSVYTMLTQPVDFRSGQPADTGYGLGTFVWDSPQGKNYGHAGMFPGYLTQVEYNRQLGLSLALQINTDGSDMRSMHGLLLELLDLLAQHQATLEISGIQANFNRQAACWNAGDLGCYMEAYERSDSIQTVSRSGVTRGYDAILKNYQTYFPQDRMGSLSFDQFNYKKLSPDYYYVVGRFNLQYRDQLRQGWFSVLMQRVRGKWLLISDHSS